MRWFLRERNIKSGLDAKPRGKPTGKMIGLRLGQNNVARCQWGVGSVGSLGRVAVAYYN